MAHLLLCASLLSFLFSTTNGDDSIAMFKLANALTPSLGGRWPNNRSTDYCTWDGVKCDSSLRVVGINLESRNLAGTLPAELSTLSQLNFLNLQENHLSGPLPSLTNLSLLQELRLDSNSFTSIPQGFFKGLANLKVLSMSRNTYLAPWTIPTDLTECVSLMTFEACEANIIGSIPDIFASFPSLQNLRLSYNKLTGTLPASFASTEIQNLWLNNMGLSGAIDVLSSMTQLKQVWLHRNKFSGPISDFSNCKSLFDLQISDNRFTGIVPASLISLPQLLNVSLSNNKLQGAVPEFSSNVRVSDGINNFCVSTPGVPCDQQVNIMLEIAGALGYPEALSKSWRGNDACENWAFIICDEQKNITTVNFGKQHFAGTISPAFSNLTALTNLFLNDNNLTGFIPDSLTMLTHLQVIDLSNNNLSGKIPAFSSSVKLIIRPGNPFLRIDTSSGIEGPNLVNSTGTRQRGHKLLPSMIVGIALAITTFIALVLLASFKYKVKKRHKMSGRIKDPENRNMSFDHTNCHISREDFGFSVELIRQVTDNFNENNILGKGGFGVVYKGKLQDESRIAVKRIKATAIVNIEGMEEFQAEIAVLTKVRHRHLVSLLGYCVYGSEGFLIYEYMPKGTLAQHLFEWHERGFSPLTWNQRVTIALDVARGVEYLHNLAEQSLSFIHRDLKPSNILLGDDMRAKVSDFGLVKNVPAGKNSSETKVAGTFGYLAPEYAETGRVTRKVDVFAFGAILMEMITGRKAIDNTREEEGWMHMHLVTWFRGVLMNKQNILNVIDQSLNPDEETLKSICKVVELAEHCTSDNPRRRPDIAHVVMVLAPLVEQWKPTSQEEEDQHTSSTSTVFNASQSSSKSLVAKVKTFLIDSQSLGNKKLKHVTF
ncbi:receptor-like kinase TMK4 [Jatropha curcas]|uniref:receptor-like kinase TMK4 n=1 Tax=Jatropha curcas TaxID=180498 RepID=UPI0005FC0FCD|nr:receptor-like kinase TMK4 [Jatropha curcas]